MIPRRKKVTHTVFFFTKSDKHFLSLVPLLKFCVLLSIFSAADFFSSFSLSCEWVFWCRVFRPTKKQHRNRAHGMLALNRMSIYVLFVSFSSSCYAAECVCVYFLGLWSACCNAIYCIDVKWYTIHSILCTDCEHRTCSAPLKLRC